MNERNRNIAVGLTALVGLIGVLTMMLLFGYAPGWLESTYLVRIKLPHASGLTAGSAVHLNGIEVGSVESVSLPKGRVGGVIVRADIREGVNIPANVEASVYRPALVGGSATVEFNTTKPVGPNTPYLPTDGSAVVQGHTGSLVGSVTSQLQETLKKPTQDIQQVAKQFQGLSEKWSKVGENLNRLIEPRNPDEVDAGKAPANLNSTIQRADARLAEMQKVIAGVQEYTNDDELRQNLREAIANGRKITETLDKRIGELSKNVNDNLVELRQRYIALADDLSGTVKSMNQSPGNRQSWRWHRGQADERPQALPEPERYGGADAGGD